LEEKQHGGDRADRRRERRSRLEDATATVARLVEGEDQRPIHENRNENRDEKRGKGQDRRGSTKTDIWERSGTWQGLSPSFVQWQERQGEREREREKADTPRIQIRYRQRVWQVGSLANGAAEWQKLSLNDLSY